MINLLNLGRIVCLIVLSGFTVTNVSMLSAHESQCDHDKDARLVLRLQEMVQELVDNQTDKLKMIKTVVDVKNDIENTYGIHINLDECMRNVSSEIHKKGVSVHRENMRRIKDRIESRMRVVGCQMDYISDTMYLDGYEFNKDDENNYFLGYHKRDVTQPNERNIDRIPAQYVWGVSVSLVGQFLKLTPVPACNVWGQRLQVMGVSACAGCVCGKIDDKENTNPHRADK